MPCQCQQQMRSKQVPFFSRMNMCSKSQYERPKFKKLAEKTSVLGSHKDGSSTIRHDKEKEQIHKFFSWIPRS